eukprot:758407-Hanusia_phi.AAC.2
MPQRGVMPCRYRKLELQLRASKDELANRRSQMEEGKGENGQRSLDPRLSQQSGEAGGGKFVRQSHDDLQSEFIRFQTAKITELEQHFENLREAPEVRGGGRRGVEAGERRGMEGRKEQGSTEVEWRTRKVERRRGGVEVGGEENDGRRAEERE